MTGANILKINANILLPISLLPLTLLTACGGGSSDETTSYMDDVTITTVTSTEELPANSTTISLIEYNDMHAYLGEHLASTRDSTTGEIKTSTRGGYARVATVIKALRARNPNSLAMNIGDTFHGGVEAFYTNGNAIVPVVNAMGFELGVPGNWDFGYGPDVTRARFDTGTNDPAVLKPNFHVIAANVHNDDAENGKAFENGSEIFWPTYITQYGGVKVGFIGLTSDIVPDMSLLLSNTFLFLEGENNYKNMIEKYSKELRADGAQIVVVMSELGIHKDLKLGELVSPGSVDVFFSAHTHEVIKKPIQTKSGAIVVEAGDDTYVGNMDITVTDGVITNKVWTLVELTESVPQDPEMLALVEAARAPFLAADVVNISNVASTINGTYTLTQPIDTVVGTTTIPLDRKNALESSFNNSWTTALKDVTGTQIARSGGERFGATIPGLGDAINSEVNPVANGQITLEDMYRFFPYNHPLVTAEITGSTIKANTEESLTKTFSTDAFEQARGWTNGIAGIDLTVDLYNFNGEKVTGMKLTDTGETIEDTKLYTVAGSLELYKDGINAQVVYDPATVGTADPKQWNAIDMYIYAIQNGYVNAITVPRNSITDTNHTTMWPNDDIVQPLYGVGLIEDGDYE